jgi:hypothetical protein
LPEGLECPIAELDRLDGLERAHLTTLALIASDRF